MMTKGDMTEVYPIMHSIERMDTKNFFSLSQNTRTQGHPVKLTGSRFRMDKRKYFFT